MRWRTCVVDGKAAAPYFCSVNKAVPQSTLTVTAKGQVTLRRDVLDHLGVRPGDRTRVEKLPDGAVSVRRLSSHRLEDLSGILKSDVKLTLDEIQQAIEDGWAGRR